MSTEKTVSKTTIDTTTTDVAEATTPVIIVDVRKRQKRSRIRDLRNGQGRLLTEIYEMVADLRGERVIEGAVQPIVLVVREKEKRGIFSPC